MKQATIVYWYAGDDLRLDGGGLRIAAWRTALEELGYSTTVQPLWTASSNDGPSSTLSRLKKVFIPMPFSRPGPRLPANDLVVATVPAVFKSLASVVDRQSLVFDWMDLWSVNALNMGEASPWSRPGGLIQSRIWKRREGLLPRLASANLYAGFGDYMSQSGKPCSTNSAWAPTPVSPIVRTVTHSRPVKKVGFIGSLNYPPNEMSLRRFFRDYGNRLHEKGIEIVVAGFNSEQVRSWGVNATVMGPVESVVTFYENIDAALVPIQHGGGIKVKAVEALSHGVPVFGTNHVREGFSPEFRKHILDIELLLQGQDDLAIPVDREAFAGRFSQSAFTDSVRGTLASRSED